MATPQLLMLYNARFNARTIRDHVEHLRKRGHVWWGRFYNGPTVFDAPAARARWPHLAQFAAERVISGEPSLLFASNHEALHVFKVTRVLFGDEPGEGARDEALPYYAGKSVPLWFRVEDSRALSYDHGSTNDWFEQRLGSIRAGSSRANGEPFNHSFDPAASVLHQFPIVVDGPSCDELFDRRTLPKGSKRWADAPDAMSSRPVQRAVDHLAEYMDASIWKRTTSETKELVANAWLAKASLERDEDIDPVSGFNCIARALELELRDELLLPLDRLAKSRNLVKLEDAIATARGSDGGPKPWTLGALVVLVKSFATHHRRELAAVGLDALVELSLDAGWLEEMRQLRNVTSHQAIHVGFDMKAAAKGATLAFFKRRGRDLAGVLDARDAVKGGGRR